MRRSQLISWRTREAASDTSSVSRENFSRSNEARSPLAVSYATPQPFLRPRRARDGGGEERFPQSRLAGEQQIRRLRAEALGIGAAEAQHALHLRAGRNARRRSNGAVVIQPEVFKRLVPCFQKGRELSGLLGAVELLDALADPPVRPAGIPAARAGIDGVEIIPSGIRSAREAPNAFSCKARLSFSSSCAVRALCRMAMRTISLRLEQRAVSMRPISGIFAAISRRRRSSSARFSARSVSPVWRGRAPEAVLPYPLTPPMFFSMPSSRARSSPPVRRGRFPQRAWRATMRGCRPSRSARR